MEYSAAALRKARRDLRKGRFGTDAEAAAWLSENRRMLDAALGRGLCLLRKKGGARLLERAGAFIATGERVSSEALSAFFAADALSLEAALALPGALFAAAALAAAAGRQTPGEAPRQVRQMFLLRRLDPEALLAGVCRAERILREDPAGVYLKMEAASRAGYRKALSRLAKQRGVSDEAAAEAVRNKALAGGAGAAGHVGAYLPLTKNRRALGISLFFAEWAAAAAGAAGAAIAARAAGHGAQLAVAALTLLPLWSVARVLSDRLLSALLPPRFLPSLDPDDLTLPLPKAAFVLSGLVPAPEACAALEAHVRTVLAGNSLRQAGLVLLLDYPGADAAELPSDAPRLAALKEAVDRLNRQGRRVLLALRAREWAPSEGAYIGRERKRGAIEDLVRLICGGENAFAVLYGDAAVTHGVRYLYALDRDTVPAFEGLRSLLCVAAHPCNAARYDAAGRVVSGYGCFAPRCETAAGRPGSLFSLLRSVPGVSLYLPGAAERWMDLFGSSVFCGKGLIDVEAYQKTVLGAVAPRRVLSHDILEGALLRTAFVAGGVAAEGFPGSPAAFYRRQERWVRGDVQNLRFLFCPLAPGGRSLPPLARLQIAENGLRAALPLFAALCVLLGAFLPGARIALFAGVLARAAPGVLASLGSLRAGLSALLPMGFGLPAVLRGFGEAWLSLGAVFYEAALQTAAAARALWRSFVSGKKTLQWTTAAQGEALGGGVAAPVLLTALCALALCFGGGTGAAYGAAALFTLPLLAGAKPRSGKKRLSERTRRRLSAFAAAHWRYFEKYTGEATAFLPPDNVQERPVFRVAMRTSPTNIGLYLLSLLAAVDLSLISVEEMLSRLTRALDTLERLPVWHGLLYNWYDLSTLEPLPPAFVSSVDCGNYLVCLTALAQGLGEYGGFPAAAQLARRVRALAQAAQLWRLYDRRRGCFSVGYNAAAGRLEDACYDMYVSEARLLSFYAAATRAASPRHWTALARPFLGGGYAASYSGTVFEYFMPALFLPVYPGTFQAAALAGCRRAAGRALRFTRHPGGMSESGYYAFDPDMNYLYRAHGDRRLALRQDVPPAGVWAPYAAFLMLPFEPAAGMKRLDRFFSLGAWGECGFYEAFDSCVSPPRAVASYMAHHVGMSLLAIVNTLQDMRFVRRFTAAPEMAAACALLAERPPLCRAVRPRRLDPPKTPPASRPAPPHSAAVYTDGEATLLCHAGGSRFLWGGTALLGYNAHSRGLFAAVRVGEKTLPLAGGRTEFLPGGMLGTKRLGALEAASALVLPGGGAFAAAVKLHNTGAPVTAELLFYFEPLFEPLFAPRPHPLFSDLGIRARREQAAQALLFSRVRGGGERLFLAVGLSDGGAFSFLCDREQILGHAPGAAHPFSNGMPRFTDDTAGVYKAGAIRCTLRLEPNARRETVLLFSPGMSEEAALAGLMRARRKRLPTLAGPARRLAFARDTAGVFERFLQTAVFGMRDPAREAAAAKNSAPKAALWAQGVSGDLPVICAGTDGVPETRLRGLLRGFAALRLAGVRAELVLLYTGGGYGDAAPGALSRLAAEAGLAGCLGAPGGVFPVDTAAAGEAFLSALAALPGARDPAVPLPPAPDVPPPLPCKPLFGGEGGFVPGGYFIAALPPRPWCHTLSNRSFGTMVSSASLGFTWALNARLNQLTPWSNDPAADFSGERLLLDAGGKTYDCLNGSAVYFYDDRAVYGAVCGGVRLRVTVQTDAVAMKKRVRVQRENDGGAPALLRYRVRPRLGETAAAEAFVRAEAADGMLLFFNPANEEYPGAAGLYGDGARHAAADGETALERMLAPGETADFYLAFARTPAALRRLAALPFSPAAPRAFRPAAGIPALDRFAGALLAHQVTDTRFMARCGFYQCSGAYGYRDQLQDALPLCVARPALARVQLLRAAAAQFPEGDVLHWFHVLPRRRARLQGVRTRCGDDRLFLPYLLARYLEAAGDETLPDVSVPFLSGAPLAAREESRYACWSAGERAATVYRHAMLAIESACRFGAHGLPLMGAGDWNDAFDAVGRRGQGESVWLSMFLQLVCLRFFPVARRFGTPADVRLLRDTVLGQRRAVLTSAWNGSWFLRGFYDDGTPLGNGTGACGIDLLPQAFAVFAGVGTREMRRQALQTAFERLFDPAVGVLRLFDPPFTARSRYAGYINDYPPGVRENGGQYTHAAVWFALALRQEGMRKEYETLLSALLPSEKDPAVYRNEPYALSGDVCAAPAPAGQGGWSLYTGAAAWLWYLVQLESGDWPQAALPAWEEDGTRNA